jgi:DNA-binding MarR family transcriptional regulator
MIDGMEKYWDPSSSISYQISLALRLLAQRNEEGLRPLQIGVAYIPVLAALANIGPLTQKELAEIARVDQSTMTLLLRRMEKADLVMRSPSPHDGRAVIVDLSDRGKECIPDSKAIVEGTARRALRGFSSVERRTLRTLLQKLITNLETQESGNER